MDFFLADTKQATDYHPFGMAMPGRSFSNSVLGYRYGFESKELDKETNSYDFGARVYDPRIGRWLSRDMAVKHFISPYNNSANNPTNNLDPDGKDEIHFHFYVESVVRGDGVRIGKKQHQELKL